MRHGDKINNLGRTAAHRRAMLANMTNSLIEHKRITTTLAKAKALRRYAEPLLTKAKDNSTHSRRIVFGYLQSKEAIQELFGPIAEKIGERPGGYVRIIKLGFRRGDGADMAMIELVDYNEIYNPKGKEAAKKKTRRGGRTSKAAEAAAAAPKTAKVAPIVEAAPVVEDVVAPVEEEVVAPVAEVVTEVVTEVAPEVVAEATAEESAPEAPAAEETKEGEEA